MTAMYRDPPEVAQFAQRGDPPIQHWPGSPTTRQRIMMATGHHKDWFRYRHREHVWARTWHEWADARRKKAHLVESWEWNQILVLGDYGDGKSTLGIKRGYLNMRRGHAFFFNHSSLIGWQVPNDDMYTAMGFMPANSTFMVGEASGVLASRVAHGVAVYTFNEMNLNTRKKGCVVIYDSAHDWEVPAAVRRNCKEVWKPVPRKELLVKDEDRRRGSRPRPADDPDNFRQAYHVWDDYPYRKANLIEGKKEEDGFGPPTYTRYDEADNVRDAYLLTDTFELAAAGAATMADRDSVKDKLAAYHAGVPPTDASVNGSGKKDKQQESKEKILLYLAEIEYDPPLFITGSDIERNTGVPSSHAGRLLQAMIDVKPVRNKGYPTDTIYRYLDGLDMEINTDHHDDLYR